MNKVAMILCCMTVMDFCGGCAAKPSLASAATTTVRINRKNPPHIGFEYYPESSRHAQEQGVCVVTLTVLADGTVKDVHVTKSTGFSALDAASVSAFTTGTLLPATKNRIPVDDTVDLPVTWSITRTH